MVIVTHTLLSNCAVVHYVCLRLGVYGEGEIEDELRVFMSLVLLEKKAVARVRIDLDAGLVQVYMSPTILTSLMFHHPSWRMLGVN